MRLHALTIETEMSRLFTGTTRQ